MRRESRRGEESNKTRYVVNRRVGVRRREGLPWGIHHNQQSDADSFPRWAPFPFALARNLCRSAERLFPVAKQLSCVDPVCHHFILDFYTFLVITTGKLSVSSLPHSQQLSPSISCLFLRPHRHGNMGSFIIQIDRAPLRQSWPFCPG